MLISDISVVMMAKNAEETIFASLESLKVFEEVVLYLNDSSDSTEIIALKYSNVKIVKGLFLGFGATKNEAAKYSSNDWILSLDSDEILNPLIINQIKRQNLSNIMQLFQLKRDNYFLGYETQDSDILVRIYNRNFTKFNNKKVHEKILLPNNAIIIRLQGSFKHLNITNINQTLTKMIQYTDLSVDENKTCFFFKVIGKSFFSFFKVYILKGNFLKGWVGFSLGINAANRRYYKYIKQFIHCKNKER